MSSDAISSNAPVLDEDTRAFIKRAIAAGLIDIEQVKKVVASQMGETQSFDPKILASGLVGSGALTTWQANKLLSGKSKGFYLGSYRLLRPLGKGGMGVVYLGEHHVMKRLMALKILPSESLVDQRRIDRFKEEARASAQLDHPNIVRAIDFAETSGKLFIVMEFVDGIDLHYAVTRDGVMSIPMAIDAVTQSALGLSHAHERGIIHRDIKPSNLLLRTDGVVKVSDMGLARIGWTDPNDSEGQKRMMGTADFVAPEQAIDSRSVDARSDIYSLGCTLYYLLTGKPPFTGASVAQRLAKHQTAPPPDIRKVRSDCPASVAELCMRMMAKRPEDRPTSALELITQLKRLGGIPTGPYQSPPLSRIAPAGDTAVDDSVYQATLDDSSLSGDSEIPQAAVVDDFDFDSLPPIEIKATPVSPSLARSTAMGPSRAVPLRPSPIQPPVQAGVHSNKTRTAQQARNDNQQLLLGVGLAIAILALLAVVSITAYTVLRPEKPDAPVIRSIEDGKGGQQVIILNQ
jgi:eukaryotic-like serine/threonine-protein kinase